MEKRALFCQILQQQSPTTRRWFLLDYSLGAYVINLDEYKSIGIHWIAIHLNAENVTYFDSFGVEHSPKEIRKFIRIKNITTNIYRIQAYDSMICGYFSIGVTDFMLKDKRLLEYTNLFSPNDYEKNHKIILKYFQ